MSRYNCASCSACKGINKTYCDNCTACCCQNNMKAHREIFYLADQFQNKISYAEDELKSKADQIKSNLSNKYSIYIGGCTCCLDHCESFLNNMRSKYNDQKYQIKNLYERIEQKKRDFKYDERNLYDDFRRRIENLRNIYGYKRENISNKVSEECSKIKSEVNRLKESKINLENETKNIKNNDINEIVNNFINDEKSKIEIDYNNQKSEIDENNKFKMETLKYTEEELNLEKSYLNTINNIKNYSKQIPFYDNWINTYKLNKYIN